MEEWVKMLGEIPAKLLQNKQIKGLPFNDFHKISFPDTY